MKPLVDVLREALEERGWREVAPVGKRVCPNWKKDGQTARSLNDALIRQMIAEIHERRAA